MVLLLPLGKIVEPTPEAEATHRERIGKGAPDGQNDQAPWKVNVSTA
jgi:hypothetical protein